jgi:hypothetical protein
LKPNQILTIREGSGIRSKAKVTLKKPYDPRDGNEPPDLAKSFFGTLRAARMNG